MQPHPHSSQRSGEAWAEPDAKPKKKRAKKPTKKAAAKKKPAANKQAGKKTAAKKQAKAGARKKPREGAVFSTSVAELVASLDDPEAARRVLAALALGRAPGDPRVEPSELAELRRELDDGKRKLAALEQKLTGLSNLVADLTAARFAPSDAGEAIESPFAKWLRDPSIAQYFDQHIAMHPALGVVAHGDSPEAVVAQLRAKGIPLDEIVLDFLSSAPF